MQLDQKRQVEARIRYR